MTTLQEAAMRKALEALEAPTPGAITGSAESWSIWYDKRFIAMDALRTALAQQREQQPVCHGCGIPAGDVHMSTCKSGKWPSRVSDGDTAAPALQAQGEIDALRQALVYVAHAGHITPRHMLPKGVMLCDGDGVVVRVPNGPEVWGGNVSDYEKRRLTDNTHPQPTAPAPQQDGTFIKEGTKSAPQPAQGEWITDEGRLKWAMWRIAELESAPQPAQGEPTGCACRWDADDNRVATCARHQGWLDVVHEWAERAKATEKAREE